MRIHYAYDFNNYKLTYTHVLVHVYLCVYIMIGRMCVEIMHLCMLWYRKQTVETFPGRPSRNRVLLRYNIVIPLLPSRSSFPIIYGSIRP